VPSAVCTPGVDSRVVCMSVLNSWYGFVDVFTECCIRVADLASAGPYLLVKVPDLNFMVSHFQFFTLMDLQHIANAHHLGHYGHRPKATIQNDILAHE
jgi:hypothetical protein